jgi:hypothetical protein
MSMPEFTCTCGHASQPASLLTEVLFTTRIEALLEVFRLERPKGVVWVVPDLLFLVFFRIIFGTLFGALFHGFWIPK